MAEREVFIDDRVIIPEWMEKMTIEEIDARIAEIEAEHRREKECILQEQSKRA